MFTKFTKVKEYFAEFLILSIILGGLFSALTNLYQMSIQLDLIKEQFQEKESDMKQKITNLEDTLVKLMFEIKDESHKVDMNLLYFDRTIEEYKDLCINEKKIMDVDVPQILQK